MKKTGVSLSLIITAIVVSLLTAPIEARAGDVVQVFRLGEYCQTDAREMLNMINSFRTGTDAWYWNSDNATKTVRSDLAPLSYDYNLEKAAMTRATELSVIYSHTRPNNRSCFTTYPDSVSGAMGENIAMGYRSAEDVFEAWKEEYDDYDGQGHRRNMLDERFTKVAISCFTVDGVKYWVQEFAGGNSSSAVTPANNEWSREYVELDSSNIVSEELIVTDNYQQHSDKLELESEYKLETGKLKMKVNTKIVHDGKVSYDSFICRELQDATSEDESIVKYDSGAGWIIAGNSGKTNLIATSSLTGKKLILPVEVVSHDINDASFMGNAGGAYTGEPIVCDEYFSYNGFPLKEGTDYSISYENNINPGTGKMIVTGLGRFKGTTRIIPMDITASFANCSFSYEDEYVYQGKPIVPKVTGYFIGKEKIELIEGKDFTVSAEDNDKPGIASVTIRGLGPYRSSVTTRSFKIREAGNTNGVTGKKPLAKGKTFTYSFGTFKVTSKSTKNPTVTLTRVNSSPKSLKIPDKVYDSNRVAYKVTAIGPNACKNKSNLKTLTVGKNVTSIGKNAFYGCGKLGKINFQSTNIKIGQNACKKIKSKAVISIKSGTNADKKTFVKMINKTGGARNSKLK